MPLYTYRCSDCGNEFDLRQSFSDDPIRTCTVCEGDVRRVIQKVSVLFKGSGFYVTDNRNSNANGSVNGKAPKEGESSSDTGKSKKDDKSAASAKKSDKKERTTKSASKSD